MNVELVIPRQGPPSLLWGDQDVLPHAILNLEVPMISFRSDAEDTPKRLRGVEFHCDPKQLPVSPSRRRLANLPVGRWVFTDAPPAQCSWNYRLLSRYAREEGESTTAVVFVSAEAPAWNVDLDAAVPVGEEERHAIVRMLDLEGIRFHPVRPLPDYSPTGRWFWSEPEWHVLASGHVIVACQHGVLDV